MLIIEICFYVLSGIYLTDYLIGLLMIVILLQIPIYPETYFSDISSSKKQSRCFWHHLKGGGPSL